MKIVIFSEDKNSFTYLLRVFEKEDKKFKKFNDIILLSTFNLENKEISFRDKNLIISNINNYKNHNETDFAIFMCNKELGERYIEDFSNNGCIVLDENSYYLNDDEIPTIIYDINPGDIKNCKNKNIIKLPSISTIQLLRTINPLYDISNIKRVVVSTYQSVSNLGKEAMDELFNHTKKIYENSFLPAENFKKQITFNVIPQIGEISFDGYYMNESRIIIESQNILRRDTKFTSTCAMVPVFVGDCQSINIEFEKEVNLEDIYDIYGEYENSITVVDRFEDFIYATPKEVALENTVFVSRIRHDDSIKNGINLFSVADNIEIMADNIVNIIGLLS